MSKMNSIFLELSQQYVESLIDRLVLSTRKTANGCIEWEMGKHQKGYGQIRIHNNKQITMVRTHRLAYFVFNGDMGDSSILHSCDNPSCINPCHLFVGTQKDNVHDMLKKKRHCNQKKTHCPKGHPYNQKNTYIGKSGRTCRVCAKLGAREIRLRRLSDHAEHTLEG